MTGAVNAGAMALPHPRAGNGVRMGRVVGRAWPWLLETGEPWGSGWPKGRKGSLWPLAELSPADPVALLRTEEQVLCPSSSL